MDDFLESQLELRVGVFGNYYPLYRKRFFQKLKSSCGFALTIHSARDCSCGLPLIRSSDVDFPVLDAKTFRLRMPFVKRSVSFQPRAVWSVVKAEYDVFVLASMLSDLSVWLCLFIARLLGRKICLWGRGSGYALSSLSDHLRKMMLHLANAVILYMEDTRQRWISGGFPSEKLFVAYNAMDTEMAHSMKASLSEEDLEHFRQQSGLRGKKVLLFSGRLQERKKPHILIEALGEVIISVPNVHAVIIGEGPIRKDLENLVLRLGLKECVTFYGSIFDEFLVARFFLCSHLGVMPAHAGLFVQHAFSYGVPLIIGDDMRDHAAEASLVVNGETGLYFKHDDCSDCARAICRLLLNETERQRMAQNAEDTIRRKYNVDNMVNGMRDAIRYVTSR